ncbi:VWA domain-containing protein, variant 2 [Balamuthia mandrillaris]
MERASKVPPSPQQQILCLYCQRMKASKLQASLQMLRSVNRHFIEGIAKAGLGEPLIITSNDEVQDKLNKFRRYIAQPVLTNVQLNFEDIDVYDVEPRSIPSLLAQRPIIVSGKYRGAVNSTSSVMVTGFTGSKSGSPSKWSSEVMSFASSQSVGDSSVLRYLWVCFAPRERESEGVAE